MSDQTPTRTDPKAEDSPLETSVRALNASALDIADAIVSLPAAAATSVVSTIHGHEALLAAGIDAVNHHPISRLLDRLRPPSDCPKGR